MVIEKTPKVLELPSIIRYTTVLQNADHWREVRKGYTVLSLNIYLLKPPVNLQPSQYTSIEKYRRSSDGKKKLLFL